MLTAVGVQDRDVYPTGTMLGIRGNKEEEMGVRVPENVQRAAAEAWRFGEGVTGPWESVAP